MKPASRWRRALMALALSCVAGAAVAAPAASDCPGALRQFALLASMGMASDSINAYRALPAACLDPWPNADTRPPGAQADTALIVQFGKQLYQQQRQGRQQQVADGLASHAIPDVDLQALQGLGPENGAQVLGAMVADLAATGLSQHGRHSQTARLLRQLSDDLRGNEAKWWKLQQPAAAYGQSRPRSSATTRSTPALPMPAVPAAAADAANCTGNLSFLADSLRPYTDPILRQLRQELLGASVPALLKQARASHPPNVAAAVAGLRHDIALVDEQAYVARQAADDTDGQGHTLNTRAAENDTLRLNWPCSQGGGGSIHGASLCGYITLRWQSMVLRTLADMLPRCTP